MMGSCSARADVGNSDNISVGVGVGVSDSVSVGLRAGLGWG